MRALTPRRFTYGHSVLFLIILCLSLGILAIVVDTANAQSGGTPAPPEGESSTLTGRILNPTQLDGLLVYAQREPSGGWRLIQRMPDGSSIRLPIRDFAQVPDADWGTTREGKLNLVYSRESARRSSLYAYDPDTGVETRLRESHDPAREEVQPTLWRGVLGFWRRARDKFADGEYRLLTLHADRPSRAVKRLRSTQSVTGADLSSRGLALTTHLQGIDSRQVTVQLKPSNRNFRLAFQASSGMLSQVYLGEPHWRADAVYWAYSRRSDSPRRQVGRARLNGSRIELSTAVPARPADARDSILNLAVDNLDMSMPIWINTFSAGFEDDPSQEFTLYPLPLGSLNFPALD